MSKQMEFFIFLLEQYAAYKNTTGDKILQQWDNLELTNFIYNMYEMYHTECLENAFKDIDNLTQNHPTLKAINIT
jgi:F0F1-type ATP synthase delta subunit